MHCDLGYILTYLFTYLLYFVFSFVARSDLVDGGWSAWSRADTCSAAPCSGIRGHTTQFRSCTDPRPMFGGTPCRGRSWKVGPCYNNEFCTDRGTYN